MVALGLVAVLIISGQVLVQLSLGRQDKDSRTINVAGRQRMLSQKISKGALAIRSSVDRDSRAELARALAKDLALWRRSHIGLLRGDAEMGPSGENSAAVRALFARLEPHFAAMSTAATALVVEIRAGPAVATDLEPKVAAILRHEGSFLETMDEIVFTYDDEANARVTRLARVEVGLTLGALFVLVLEALFIFRPAVRRLRRTLAALVSAKRVFQELSQSDGLTGIANRRFFDHYLAQECRRAGRDSKPVSVILIDVDHFKQYNETFGHQKGDQCLQQVAAALAGQAKRPADMVARYGGDEFVAVLPDTHLDGAVNVASSMREGVKFLGIEHAHPGIEKRLSVSLGVATGIPTPGSFDPDAFLSAADDALFRAKRQSRDAIVTVQLAELGVGEISVAD